MRGERVKGGPTGVDHMPVDHQKETSQNTEIGCRLRSTQMRVISWTA
jgi:hypothetical protein